MPRDIDSIQRTCVHSRLQPSNRSISPSMREHAISAGNVLDRDYATIGRDRHACREANSAGDARLLADRGLPGILVNPDDLSASPLRGAERDALKVTALRLAAVFEDDGDPHGDVRIGGALFKRASLRFHSP